MPTYHFMVGRHVTMEPFKRIKVTAVDTISGKRTTVRTDLNGIAKVTTSNEARLVVHTYEPYELLSLSALGVNVDYIVASDGTGTYTALYGTSGALEAAIATGADQSIWLCTTHVEAINSQHALSALAIDQRITVLSAGRNKPVLSVGVGASAMISVDGTSLSGVGSALRFQGFAFTRTDASAGALFEVSGGGILPGIGLVDIGFEAGSSGWTYLLDTDTIGSGQVRSFAVDKLSVDTTLTAVATSTLTSASTGSFRVLASHFAQLTHFIESAVSTEMGATGVGILDNTVTLMKGYALPRRFNYPLVMDGNTISDMDAAVDWLDLGSAGSIGIHDAVITDNYLKCTAAGASAFHIPTPAAGSVAAISITGNTLVGPGSGTAIKVDDPAPGSISGCLILNAYRGWTSEVVWGGSGSPGIGGDHSLLSNLGVDDHAQYALLAGRSGGQTLIGGTGASDALTLESTSHATKGPVAIVAGSTLQINDSDYVFFITGGDPTIVFDHASGSPDRFRFERDTPSPGIGRFLYEIAGVTKLGIGVSDIQVGVAGSAPSLILESMDGTSEGGELELRGAAAFTDWHQDNYMGALRWYESSTVRMHLAGGASPKLTVFGEVESLGSVFRLTNKGNIVKDFGDATIGALQDTVTVEEQNARKVTLEAGRYTLLSAHGKTVSGTASVRYAIYTDNVGVPDALVGYTATITVTTTDQWWPASIAFDANGNDISFFGSITVEETGTYWISIHSDGDVNNLEWDYHAGGVSYEGNADAFSGGPEGTWSGGAGGTKGYSLFARAAPLGILYTARVGTGDTNFYYESSQGNLVGPLMGHNNARLPDNSPLYFGSSDDASILYDGTDLIVNPQLVGSGTVRFEFSTDPHVMIFAPTAFSHSVESLPAVYTVATFDDPVPVPGFSSFFLLQRAGGTIASPTNVLSSWSLGQFGWRGYGDGAFRNAAYFEAFAREDFDVDDDHGTDIDIFVTKLLAANPTLLARFREDYLMVDKIWELTSVAGLQLDNFLEVPEVAAPSTPAAGFMRVYGKSDNKLYLLDDAGVETDLTAGSVGATGPMGPPGVDGEPGEAGLEGAAGSQGAIGAMGSTGATGATGAQGVPGVEGEDGAEGAQGPQGVAGDAGATGDTGATGAAGAAGADGLQGPPGVDGEQGESGPPGLPSTPHLYRYLNVPDAGPGDVLTTIATAQGVYHHSGPVAEKAEKLYVDAKTAPGASGLPCTWSYGDTNDLDTVASWTTIATLTLSSEMSSSTETMTNAVIPANRLVRVIWGTIVGSPTDAQTVLVTRPVA